VEIAEADANALRNSGKLIETYVNHVEGYKFNFFGHPDFPLDVGDIVFVWGSRITNPYGKAKVTKVLRENEYQAEILGDQNDCTKNVDDT